MSTYLGATEVTLILPAAVSIGTNTPPLTLGEVASAIVEHGAELDSAAAAAGYAVPVSPSTPAAYAQMQRYAKTGVAGWILGVLAPNHPGARGDKLTLASEYRQEYEKTLERLREGKLILVGNPRDTGETVRALARHGGRATPAAHVDDTF